MGETKKVKSTGRFGSRYGVGIKKRVLKVEEKQKNLNPCPFCGFKKINRVAAGLFKCNKCDAKFTGGAYETETLSGKSVRKMVSQRVNVTEQSPIVEKESSYYDIEKEVSKLKK
jgi:large subunit ribosomal protein L37Ae